VVDEREAADIHEAYIHEADIHEADQENQHYVHTDDVERHPNAERRVQQYADL
jgi:hypothetical protein